MKYKFKFLYKFFISLVVLFFANSNVLALYAEELINISLDKELKEGNILIGLKQFLGQHSANAHDNQSLLFKSDKSLLTLQSSNGINFKSNELKIIWEKVALDEPIVIERYVLGPFSSFESAKKEANILIKQGYEPTITYPSTWQIWLPSETDILFKNEFNFRKEVIKYKIVPTLIDDLEKYQLDGPILVNSENSININNIDYGKEFYLAKDSYGTWTLIQKLSFDEYLEGVLPHEIGANSPLEALKAQAVIARTWAIYNSDRFNPDHYHLCITTQCQVYKPTENLNQKIKIAIEQTSSFILAFDNNPINSFYHASNGGVSANSSESWQMESYPYLQSKLDILDSSKKDFQLPFNSVSQINDFLDNEDTSFIGKDHYLFRWDREVSSNEIREYLIKNNLMEIHQSVGDLQVLKRGPSGRVTQLKIIISNSNKDIILVKDDIRRNLGFLPSNLFIINKLNDNLWSFKGGGFGHGVGLSQSGAIEMAKAGFNFREILNHYYQGAVLLDIKNLK